MGPRLRFSSIYRTFDAMDGVDVAARLALMVILLSDHVAADTWYLKAVLRGLAILGLLAPPLHRNPHLWLLATFCFLWKTVDNWWIQDNHLFLFTYLCLAFFLALRLTDPGKALATSCRIMIGLSFAFAALWKGFLSPDYMDGTYFHYTILGDVRFFDLGMIVGRLSEAAYSTNGDLIRLLAQEKPDVPAVTLQSTRAISHLSLFMTWWTVLIEGLLGLAFLWPGDRGPARIRNWTLLLFGWTTYTVATVPTFGWTLMTLGAAQCRPEERIERFLYGVTCALVLIFSYAKILSLIRPLIPAPS